jgi:hypothetical protein
VIEYKLIKHPVLAQASSFAASQDSLPSAPSISGTTTVRSSISSNPTESSPPLPELQSLKWKELNVKNLGRLLEKMLEQALEEVLTPVLCLREEDDGTNCSR